MKDGAIIIISSSIFQVNDGAVDPGSMSLVSFASMSINDKYRLYKDHSDELYSIVTRLDKYLLYDTRYIFSKSTISPVDHGGFLPITTENKTTLNSLQNDFILDENKIKHRWYKNLNIEGVRWKQYKDVLEKMSQTKATFIIYQPPVMPLWKEYTHNSFIDKSELQYVSNLKKEVSKYHNIKVVDFYSVDNDELTNDKYYDIQHTNAEGAKIFTRMLYRECISQ